MSDRDIIDTIARAMRRRVRYPTDEAAQHNAVAILAALRERYAIVELPEPVGNMVGPFRFSRGAGCECCPPEVYDTDTEVSYSVSEARVEAAALLAASAAAEADQ